MIVSKQREYMRMRMAGHSKEDIIKMHRDSKIKELSDKAHPIAETLNARFQKVQQVITKWLETLQNNVNNKEGFQTLSIAESELDMLTRDCTILLGNLNKIQKEYAEEDELRKQLTSNIEALKAIAKASTFTPSSDAILRFGKDFVKHISQ